MNIHLPAILGFTRYQGFDPSPYFIDFLINVHCIWPGTEKDQYQLAVSLAFD